MKKIIIILSLLYSFMPAQNVAYVDSRYILENIPEFSSAQDELNNFSVEWQEEIDILKQEVEKLYRTYQAEQYLLPEDKKRNREEMIILKEKEIKSLTKQRFGPDGDLYQKQQQLILVKNSAIFFLKKLVLQCYEDQSLDLKKSI